MKKKLLVLCSILLIIGCSKTEPKQEEDLTIVKSTVETESVEVAGASYNPNVQGEEEKIEEIAEEPEVTVTIEEPSKEAVTTKPVYKKEKPSKYIKPVEPVKSVEPEKEEIDTAIEGAIQKKIEEDKMVTKAPPVTEVVEETSEAQETPKKSNTTLYAIIAAIAAAGAGIFFFNKK